MTTDTAAQLDLIRQQRDHAEQEVHRLREQLTKATDLLEDAIRADVARAVNTPAEPGYQRIADDTLATIRTWLELDDEPDIAWINIARLRVAHLQRLRAQAKTVAQAWAHYRPLHVRGDLPAAVEALVRTLDEENVQPSPLTGGHP